MLGPLPRGYQPVKPGRSGSPSRPHGSKGEGSTPRASRRWILALGQAPQARRGIQVVRVRGRSMAQAAKRAPAGHTRDERNTLIPMVEGTSASPIRDRARRLAAVWFCDVVGSTEIARELGDRRFRWLIDRYLALARSVLRQHGGREIDTAGDGVFAIFDAPAAALRAAFEATAAVRGVGLEIRAGVHLGEVEQDPGGRVGGIAVHIGSRVAS